MWWGPSSMTKNHDTKWAFRPGRARDGNNRGRSEGEENIGVFPVTVGGWGRAMRIPLVHARAWVQGVGL